MKIKELENVIRRFNKDLYAFAYGLQSSEATAQEMVLEAVFIFLEKKREQEVSSELELDSSLEGFRHILQIKIDLYKEVYSSGIRKTEIPANKVGDKNFLPFYGLEKSQRAVLFLRQKTAFDKAEIEQIIGVNRPELLALLSRSRNQLMNNIGLSWNEWAQHG